VVKVLILIHPPPVLQQLVSEQVPSGISLTIARKIMEYTMFGVPQFDGQNGQRFEMWSIRMNKFLEAQGYDV
jgi:hypothetical protein